MTKRKRRSTWNDPDARYDDGKRKMRKGKLTDIGREGRDYFDDDELWYPDIDGEVRKGFHEAMTIVMKTGRIRGRSI